MVFELRIFWSKLTIGLCWRIFDWSERVKYINMQWLRFRAGCLWNYSLSGTSSSLFRNMKNSLALLCFVSAIQKQEFCFSLIIYLCSSTSTKFYCRYWQHWLKWKWKCDFQSDKVYFYIKIKPSHMQMLRNETFETTFHLIGFTFLLLQRISSD